MGLLDNLAKALADRIVKVALAPENTNLPREQNVGNSKSLRTHGTN